MISSMQELRRSKAHIETCKKELEAKGIFSPKLSSE
jgi:phosphoenolpyruvate-protein kinase (PTS system EI component)